MRSLGKAVIKGILPRKRANCHPPAFLKSPLGTKVLPSEFGRFISKICCFFRQWQFFVFSPGKKLVQLPKI
ncbi:hypothetical protein COS54_01965 [Candidatus Shapirobacteria bacterium CG03_land_8_20_14_0_80_39_12]|uniref:Uncharacterized protein n=1 Tax=Candidatus Shapirobacteria bacterium CG03_land_8_20_14_0_80_39_12 TaxID=1974879 RepID=A0A2M7BCX6_9BACT|nr:MAG: hypothetical protein COS54_01965 [Candidatus Shapirobacteria bacterium CG03_land_8_20_14_0_80_39_12]